MAKAPSSGRRTPSKFLNDDDGGDNSLRNRELIYPSPRSNICQMTHCEPVFVSQTNLIGDSIAISEENRAVAFSKYGEKLMIQLDEEVDKSLSSGPLKPKQIDHTCSRHSKQYSESHLNLTIEKDNKTVKRNKAARRQKGRLAFTPRRVASSDSTHGNMPARSSHNLCVETQTNPITNILTPRHDMNNFDTIQSQNLSSPTMPVYEPTNALYTSNHQNVRQQRNNATCYSRGPLVRPITPRLYTKSTEPIKHFSEIRGIVSFLTLITVISWLITIYFELDILTALFKDIVQLVHNWYVKTEKPKTKMEIVIEFLADMWK